MHLIFCSLAFISCLQLILLSTYATQNNIMQQILPLLRMCVWVIKPSHKIYYVKPLKMVASFWSYWRVQSVQPCIWCLFKLSYRTGSNHLFDLIFFLIFRMTLHHYMVFHLVWWIITAQLSTEFLCFFLLESSEVWVLNSPVLCPSCGFFLSPSVPHWIQRFEGPLWPSPPPPFDKEPSRDDRRKQWKTLKIQPGPLSL